jgi:hypothetical protein
MKINVVRKVALCLLIGALLFISSSIIVSRYGVTYFSTFKPHGNRAQIGLFSAANLLGKAEAHWDSLTGNRHWKEAKVSYAQDPWLNEMERLLKERYRVTVDRYASDRSSPWWMGYASGYNNVVSGQIDKEHGAGALHASLLEAAASNKPQR